MADLLQWVGWIIAVVAVLHARIANGDASAAESREAILAAKVREYERRDAEEAERCERIFNAVQAEQWRVHRALNGIGHRVGMQVFATDDADAAEWCIAWANDQLRGDE